MKHSRRRNRRKGQTSVEYIMLLAAITGALAVFRKALEPYLVDFFRTQVVEDVETLAWKGGRSSALQYYSSPNGKPACSSSGGSGGGGCP